MKKLARYFLLIAILTLMLAFFPACGKTTVNVEFYGIENVELSITDDGYDFDSVYAEDENGSRVEVTVDLSAVCFGTAGQYTVYFNAGTQQKTATIYIYGTPAITTDSIVLSQSQIAQKSYEDLIVAKDSFNNALKVEAVTDFAVDGYGVIVSGEQTIRFRATDKKNNFVEKDITVEVLPVVTKYEKATVTVDYAKAYHTFENFDSQLKAVYNGGDKLSMNCYVTNDSNHLMLMPALIKELGVGEHKLRLEFVDGISLVDLTVTNNQPFNYVIDDSINNVEFEQYDTITLPELERHQASIQEFNVNYYILYPSVATKTAISDFDLSLDDSGAYTYYIDILDGSVVKDTIEYDFTVNSIEQAYAKNLITKTAILNNGGNGNISIAYEEQASISYNDGTSDTQTTLPSLTVTANGLPRDSALSHLIVVDETVISKVQKAGISTLYITCYTNCGLAFYTKNNQGGFKEAFAFSNKTDKVIEKNLKINLSSLVNGLYIDAFCANTTSKIYFTELTFKSFSTSDMVNAETLEFVTKQNVTVTYEESVSLGGINQNAIKITADNTGANGWAQTHYAFIPSSLMALKGENTRLYIKFYSDCSVVLADWQGNGKGQIVAVSEQALHTYQLDLTANDWANGGIRICIGNSGTATVYITELSFRPAFNINDMVNEETLDHITPTLAQMSYVDSVELGGQTLKALKIKADASESTAWTHAHCVAIGSGVFNQRGTRTKLHIKLYVENGSVYPRDNDGNYLVGQYNAGEHEITIDLTSNSWALSGLHFWLAGGTTAYITELNFVD